MYPGGVQEMTALDPELSESARAPGQQAIIRSLETYWNDNKDKLDTWTGDWVTKRQPAPDESLP